MQATYRLPYDKFERYSPYGSAAEVTDFLGPYVEAGCTTFNLIPCGDNPDTVITMASEIHRQLTGDARRTAPHDTYAPGGGLRG